MLTELDGLTLSLASGSDALEGIVETPETGTEIGYDIQTGNLASLLMLNIFTMGILAGLVMGVIFWRKL